MGSETSGSSFDEQAALEELERLQRAIRESRRQRGETVAEFDAFVRGFRDPEPIGHDLASATAAPSVKPASVVAAASTRSVSQPGTAPESAAANVEPSPPAPAAARPTALRVRGRRLGLGALVAGLGVIAFVVAVVVVLVVRGRGVAPPTPSSSIPASTAPTVTTPPTTSPAPAASQGPPPQAEIVTLRPVWLRVTVDGERTIEREVPANERIPLKARRTIAIRAGDASAVRVMLAGQDQGVLGRTGEVVNRTFTVPTGATPR